MHHPLLVIAFPFEKILISNFTYSITTYNLLKIDFHQPTCEADGNGKTLSSTTSEPQKLGKENVETILNIDDKNAKEKGADGNDANIKWKEENRKLEMELQTIQEKLKRKQECLVQVQQEKENQYVALR